MIVDVDGKLSYCSPGGADDGDDDGCSWMYTVDPLSFDRTGLTMLVTTVIHNEYSEIQQGCDDGSNDCSMYDGFLGGWVVGDGDNQGLVRWTSRFPIGRT